MNGSFLPVDRLHKISLGLQHLSLALGFGRTERGFSTLLPVLETLGLLSKHSLELSLRLLLLALLLALILPAHAAVASQPTCGIILMHGKWGMPQSPYLKPVVEKLSPDCRVVLLEMPWSRKRLYDKPYRDALQQIGRRQLSCPACCLRDECYRTTGCRCSLAIFESIRVGQGDKVAGSAGAHRCVVHGRRPCDSRRIVHSPAGHVTPGFPPTLEHAAHWLSMFNGFSAGFAQAAEDHLFGPL